MKMKQMKFKVAIIGCGSFTGDQYLKDIGRICDAELVAVCDIVPERAWDYAKRAGISQWYKSIDELLAQCDFDILMNATSIPAHHEINMKALTAGKHVFTQKPAAPTIAQVTEQMKLAAEMGVKMNAAPVHAMRHANRKCRQMLNDGVLGKVTTIRCQVAHGGPEYFQYRSNDPSWFYESDSGALYDMGVHGLHYVTDIMGPAKAVGCMAACSLPERIVRTGTFDGKVIRADNLPDNYIITLDFGNSAIGEVYTGFCQRASRMPTMEVYGDYGTISFVTDPGEHRPHLEVYYDKPSNGIAGWMRPRDLLERDAFYCDTFCLQDLIDAISQDRNPVLSMARHRHIVDIVETIPKCLETGKVLPLNTTFTEEDTWRE